MYPVSTIFLPANTKVSVNTPTLLSTPSWLAPPEDH
jgi:hypothetical protein